MNEQPKYHPSEKVEAQINSAFVYHPPKDDQPARYVAIRDAGKAFAMLIASSTPTSREQSVALTKLEEVVMWANAAIARNEKGE